MHRAPPPAWQASLFIGLILGVFGIVPTAAFQILDLGGGFDRWELWNLACSFAQLVLITYGLFALAARQTGTARLLVRVAAIVYAVMLAWEVVRPILLAQHGEFDEDIWTWSWRVYGVAELAAVIVLSIASRAWSRMPIAPILALVATLLAGWTPWLGHLFLELFDKHRILYELFWPIREVAYALGLIGMAHLLARQAGPPVPDRAVATGGLRRMAVAIVTLAGAIGVAMVSAFTHLDESTSMLVYWVPGVSALAVLAIVWCVLDVERARLPSFGHIRLALGAAMLAWWAAILAESIVGYFTRESDLRYLYPRDNGWLVVGPVLAMLALALISSAIAAGGAAVDAVRRDSLAARNIIAIVLGAFGVLLAVVLLLSEGRNAVLLAVLAMGFVIGALVVLASMVALLARALDELPGLPTARQV